MMPPREKAAPPSPTRIEMIEKIVIKNLLIFSTLP